MRYILFSLALIGNTAAALESNIWAQLRQGGHVILLRHGEVDGDSHAGRESYDAARTVALEARGYRVIRFTNHEVLTNLEGVTRAILIALGRDSG